MKSILRPTSINDLDKVRRFLQQAFNANLNAPFLDPAVMVWKYWDRRADWQDPRGYVLERDGAIVAHVGVLPLTFEAQGLRGVQMIDWASSKDAPGAGLAILQKLDAMFDFIYSIGGSEMTRRILPAYGFVEYARQWRAARPLRPVRQILSHQRRNWKLVPRLARNLQWARLPTNAHPPATWTAEEINPSQILPDLNSRSAEDAFFSPRPPGFFEYLLRCPVMQTRLYGIRNQEGFQGHFAIGVLRGQARVAGVWLVNPGDETWQTAFALASRVATNLKDANEIVVTGSCGVSEKAAIAAGFRVTGSSPVFLLNKKRKLSLSSDFQFQLSDDDAFFLDTGDAPYWT